MCDVDTNIQRWLTMGSLLLVFSPVGCSLVYTSCSRHCCCCCCCCCLCCCLYTTNTRIHVHRLEVTSRETVLSADTARNPAVGSSPARTRGAQPRSIHLAASLGVEAPCVARTSIPETGRRGARSTPWWRRRPRGSRAAACEGRRCLPLQCPSRRCTSELSFSWVFVFACIVLLLSCFAPCFWSRMGQ